MSHSLRYEKHDSLKHMLIFAYFTYSLFKSDVYFTTSDNSTNRPETRVVTVTVTVNHKAYTWQICDPHKLTCIVPHNYTSLSQTIYLRLTYLKQQFFFKEISILMNHGQSIYLS